MHYCTTIAFGVWSVLFSSACLAQSLDAVQRVGIMVNGNRSEQLILTFRENFRRLGHADERLALDVRFAEGNLARHAETAADLASQKVDVILALGGPAARAAQKATTSVPIVFSIVTDPVALGLVASRERPGGNITGVTGLDPDQAKKQMELVKEVFPALKRITVLSDDTIPGADARGLAPIDRANEQAAQEVGLQATIFKLPAGPNPDLEGAFRSIAANGAEAVLVLETPVPFAHRNRIAQIASANRMPTMFPGGQSETGGLITYGTSVVASWPMMVDMAHKILKGASPATIAVEAVNRRELIINMKTARELGVVVPEAVLKRSDKVIE